MFVEVLAKNLFIKFFYTDQIEIRNTYIKMISQFVTV